MVKAGPGYPGDCYVFVQESYRNEHGQPRNRTVEKLGLLSGLTREDPEALAKLKARVKQDTVTAKGQASGVIGYDTRLPADASTPVNLGWCWIEAWWRRLGLDVLFRQQAEQLGTSVDLETIARTLVVLRIVAPGSKKASVDLAATGLFPGVELDVWQVYRSLDVIASLAEAAQVHARSAIHAGEQAWSFGFYDVTNYYFTPDLDDPLVEPDRGPKTVAKRGQAVRRRGCSKEHRASVIIQMGLLLDPDQIPVAYRLFDGMTPDVSTLKPVLEEFKTMFHITKLIVVADKAMHTDPNLQVLVHAGDGFVFSATARHAHKTVKQWILDPDGWRWDDDTHQSKTKTRLVTRSIPWETPEGLPIHKDIQTLQIATWDASRAARDHHLRDQLVERASGLTGSMTNYKTPVRQGARKYIKEHAIDADGVITDKQPAVHLDIDQDRIDQDALYDGYHMVTTSQTEIPASEILAIYHQLWQIEDCFKVTKTTLKTRPVFVWTPQHIEAHFLTCFLALLILRLMQHQLGHRLDAPHIVDAIRGLTGQSADHGVYLMHRPPDWDIIDQATGHPLNQKWATLPQLRAWRRDFTITTI